jgi:uncharacterized membrane protein
MVFLGWLVATVLAFAALAIARSAGGRAEKTEREVAELRRVLQNLAHSIAELRKHGVASPNAAAQAAPSPPTPPEETPAPVPEPVVTAAPPPPPEPRPVQEPAQQPVVETAPPPVVETPLEQPAAAATTPTEQPPPRPPVTPPPPSRPLLNFDWEGLIGIKLFSGIAAVALVLAAIYMIKLAVESGWLTAPRRAAMGLITGAGLLFVCELRIARGYKVTANALHGAGIAILYATLFAIYARWHLAPATLVFALMIGVTAVAVWLSIRRESIFIAMLGLIGGFATPAMISTGENKPIGLFTYLLLLNAGMAWVAMRRRWTTLTAISLVLTVIYQWGWIVKFLTVAQLPLAAGIFLLFGVAAGVALWLGRRDDAAQAEFDKIAVAGAVLPLLFGAYVAAVPAYGTHYNILFGFLLLVCGGLAAVAVTRGPEWLHLLGAGTTLLVFAIWRATSFNAGAWPAALAWTAAFFALYLGTAVKWRTKAVYAAPLLLFLFPTYVLGGTYAARPGLLFGVLFILLAAAAAYAIVFEEGLVYYLGTFAALAAEAAWSGTYLTKERLIPGLALYALFALFYLGVPLIARRLRKRLEPQVAFTVLVLLSIAMLFFLDAGNVANASLWGLTLLLAILNLGALMQARQQRFPLLSVLAAILSWIVIAVWWTAATITAALTPALFVVAGFGVLVVLGNVLARPETKGAEAAGFENSTYLGLAGHLFLLFVATQKQLAFPPWPIFGVLFVLQLALGVAALWLRRVRLLTVGSLASQVVLLVWATNTSNAPFPNIALVATLVIVAMTIIWYHLDRRFSESALVATLAGQFVAIAGGLASRPPLFVTLLAAHAALLIALFYVAWREDEHFVVTIAAVTSALAIGFARTNTPAHQLTFAAVIYALFLLYPLLLGKRAKQSLNPYLAPVLASAAFFGFAYDALVDMGYKRYIGALPVFQAILLLLLLTRLLQIERDVAKTLSRLALIAGAALAFITLAIPLQLDKEWITVAWALEGAALIWLYHRIPHRGLLLWGSGLLAVVVVRLTLNPAVLSYHPPQHTAILNWYLYTYLVAAVSLFAAGYFMPAVYKRVASAMHGAGTLLLFFLLNIEIADYFSTGPALTFNFFSSALKQDLMYTIWWALFAVGLLIAGIILHTRTARVAAILLLVLTILKCFLHDLARLGGLYRVGSLVGLAASLVLVGLLLQKYIIRRAEPPEAPAT